MVTKMGTLTLMLHSQKFDITIEDDFAIWLSVTLHHDFKDSNISRLEMLNAYVSKVYELYIQEQQLEKMINSLQ